jgi:hypothetical protein
MMLNQIPEQLKLPDLGLFPLQEYWRWAVIRRVNVKLKPGERHILWDYESAGWLYWVYAKANDPDIYLRIDLKSLPSTIEAEMTFRELYDLGFANSPSIRLLRYDDVNKVYCAELAPGIIGFLGAPFRDRISAIVFNPTDHEIEYSISAWIILLKSEKI